MASVFVITGPSGVGKGTLIAALRRRHPELELSVSATTRPPRPGERDGDAYHFLSDTDFERRLALGEFVEHAVYAGHRYGTLRGELDRRARGGGPVILELELQGARQIREAISDAVAIFIAPASFEQLGERLIERGADDPEGVARRLAIARTELAASEEFRYVVVNDDVERAASELDAIYVQYAG